MSLVAQEVLTCLFCNKPITKLNGLSADSLCNHHITYVPEVIVPTHRVCHMRYHNTHPDHPANPETEYKKRFFENLDGKKVICFLCGEEITKLQGKDSNSLALHSLDGNHSNWDPDNKVPTHFGCHMRYHSINTDECVRHNISIDAQNTRDDAWRKRRVLQSIKSKRYWDDLNSVYNSAEFSAKQRTSHLGVPQPYNWPTRRARYGTSGAKDPAQYSINASIAAIKSAAARWANRRKKYGSTGVKDPIAHSVKMKAVAVKAQKTRIDRYGPTGLSGRPFNVKPKSAKWRMRHGEAVRWAYTWKHLAQTMVMLFDDIVDEEAKIFPCPYCDRVFSSKRGLATHVGKIHESRESEELKLSSTYMVEKIGVNTNG